jgi:hypothetical protein
MIPLAHSRCTVIKVHGDYLSPDLKNTVEELGSYDPALDALLDQVFDQYGVVVCGWSAEWDAALRNAIVRAPGRRYASYWCRRGSLSVQAGDVVAHRAAIGIPISGADEFFADVASKVAALAGALDQRPMSTALAINELKRCLANPIHRIRLYDLVMSEIERLCDVVKPELLPVGGPPPVAAVVIERMQIYEKASATAIALLGHGGFFGATDDHDQLLLRAVRRLATRKVDQGGLDVLTNLQQYPTLLLLYALGLGALAADRAIPLAKVLAGVTVEEPNGQLSIAMAAANWRVLNHDVMKQFPGLERRKTPISEHLYEVLREPLRPLLTDDKAWALTFDELEYLFGLLYADQRGEGVGPIGGFAWRRMTTGLPVGAVVRHRDLWLASGLFGGSAERLEQTRTKYDSHVAHSEARF